MNDAPPEHLSLLDLDRARLAELFGSFGEPRYRAKQLWTWLHARRADSLDAMTDLPRTLRERLAAAGQSPRVLREAAHRVSADGLTEKWLWDADDAPGGFETVLIREQHERRRTVCVSSIVGCPLGCVFCATGHGGFERNLSRGEILEQIYRVDAACRASGDAGERAVTNVVFMGMGEPLLNYDEVLAAARTLCDPDGLGLSVRHVTISTVGVVTGIRRLTEENANVRLAVSLHAPTQSIREALLPAARRWKLPELLTALHEFAKDRSRDITIEYCLVNRVNSLKKHAVELAELLRGLPCKVNLIPLNPVDGYDGEPPPPDRTRAFRDVLESRRIPATIRVEKGGDIDAACGQLRANRRA